MQLEAQCLTERKHLPLCGDSLVANKLTGVPFFIETSDSIWDFSNLCIDSAEIITMEYSPVVKDSAFIALHREGTNFTYHYVDNTFSLDGYQNASSCVHYTHPLPVLKFPFTYGDSIKTAFTGSGQYCHFLPLEIKGTYCSKVEGKGKLVLPNAKVDSVLCIHSLFAYQDLLQRRNHIIEDRYQWYSSDYRYPLVEVVNIRTIKENDTISVGNIYYLPIEDEQSVSRLKPQSDSVHRQIDELISNVSYHPNPVYGEFWINYRLVHAAQVYISVHYNGGVSVFQTQVRREEEGEHEQNINMSGLPIGTYVVYIHADNTIVSGNIIKL